jgi:hypothetical protein
MRKLSATAMICVTVDIGLFLFYCPAIMAHPLRIELE